MKSIPVFRETIRLRGNPVNGVDTANEQERDSPACDLLTRHKCRAYYWLKPETGVNARLSCSSSEQERRPRITRFPPRHATFAKARGGCNVTLWRQWPSSIVLLCLGLMPAGDARCFAADPPAAQPSTVPAPPRPALVPAAAAPQEVDFEILESRPAAQPNLPPAPQVAEPDPAQPATETGSLLGALLDTFGGQRPAPPAEDPNIRNLEAEFSPQFQQLLYVELAFLRRVCKPDAKPFAEVAKAAKADLHVPLHEYVVKLNMARQQHPLASKAADPRAGMQKLLLPLVKAKLGPAKAQVYCQECDKRSAARKHAVVVNVVAALDERLVLTAPQRAKLVQSLPANYENAWDQWLEMSACRGQEYLPSIRDESLVPLLDEKQKSVWKQAEKLDDREVSFGLNGRDPFGGESTELQEIAHIVEEVQDGR